MFLIFAALLNYAHAQKYDFYEAAGVHGAPVLVFVHGGAWVSRDKKDYKPLGEALALKGVCAAIVNYGLAPMTKHPEQIDQLDAAISDLKKKRSKICDVSKVYLMGHSAGAHMIAFWNTKYRNRRVHGFIGIEGIYDLPKLSVRWPAYKDQFLTAEFGGEVSWAVASPSRLDSKAQTPWLLIQSADDELVDQDQTETFAKHLRGEKSPVVVKILHKLGHFEALDSLKDPKSEASKALAEFLKLPN